MLTYPKVPESFAGLNDDALKQLGIDLTDAILVVTSGKFSPSTPQDQEDLKAAVTGLQAAKAEEARRSEENAEQAKLMADAKALVEASVAAPPEPEVEDPEVKEPEAEAEVPEPEITEPEAEVKAATRVPAKPKPGVGSKDVPTGDLKVGHFTAMDNVPNLKPGTAFSEKGQLATAIQERAKTAGDGRTPVARIVADYPKERILDADTSGFNLGDFESLWGEGSSDELAAAMCAPCTPYYNLACMNDTSRPVFNSLPQFAAPRGCVSIYPSPSLSDITGGYGFWTNDQDSAVPLVPKNACQTIACANSATYRIYGVYRCLTIQNLLQLTFPELIEAYLNRLAAATFRSAEIQLLNLMATTAGVTTAQTLGTSASVSVASQILQYVTGYAERQRFGYDQFDMWAPRWLANYLRIDIGRRRNTNGGPPSLGSMADVNRIFSDVGITVHWFIDTPTWGTAISNVSVAAGVGVIPLGPSQVKVLIAPRGKYALMDRGELRVGVSGDNIYRDNTSNSLNQFTMFFETFEGIVDTGGCPADVLTLPVCFNGVQVADSHTDCGGVQLGSAS